MTVANNLRGGNSEKVQYHKVLHEEGRDHLPIFPEESKATSQSLLAMNSTGEQAIDIESVQAGRDPTNDDRVYIDLSLPEN